MPFDPMQTLTSGLAGGRLSNTAGPWSDEQQIEGSSDRTQSAQEKERGLDQVCICAFRFECNADNPNRRFRGL